MGSDPIKFLSKTYKMKTGENFTDYLTTVRRQKNTLSSAYHEKESCRTSEFRLVFRERAQYDEQN